MINKEYMENVKLTLQDASFKRGGLYTITW